MNLRIYFCWEKRRPIPYDDLKRLGIPPPPEGRYMSRYQVTLVSNWLVLVKNYKELYYFLSKLQLYAQP